MKKKHVALALAAAMAVTTVGGATVYASEEHGPSSEAAPAWENYDAVSYTHLTLPTILRV